MVLITQKFIVEVVHKMYIPLQLFKFSVSSYIVNRVNGLLITAIDVQSYHLNRETNWP